MFKYFAAILTCTALCSCNSFKRQCEETDWYKHAFEVARTGKRLSGDEYLNRCKKEEAEISDMKLSEGFKAGMDSYCTPNRAFEVGFNGQNFNQEFCDSDKNTKLIKRHAEGVSKYCEKSNAYRVGAEGKSYTGICSKDLENMFLPEFRKGRKVYLNGQVEDKTQSIENVDDDIRTAIIEQTRVSNEINFLPRTTIIVKEKVLDHATGKYIEQSVIKEDPNIASRRDQLQWSLNQTSQKINKYQEQKRVLREEIQNLKKELRTLN